MAMQQAPISISTPSVNPEYVDVTERVVQITSGREAALLAFLKACSKLEFAQVCSVTTPPGEKITTKFLYPEDDEIVCQTFEGEVPDFTEEQEKRNVERHADTFKVIAKIGTGNTQRIVYAHSNQQSHWDPVTFRFTGSSKGMTLLPRVGERIAGLPFVNKNRSGGQSMRFWFTCSEQFFRFVRAIKTNGESLNKEFGFGLNEQRRRIFAGNTFNTFAYARWMAACEDHHLSSGFAPIESMPDHLDRLFFCHRAEELSRENTHIYSALVLILLYGELPCQGNVPFNRDLGPVCKTWELPEGWIESMISTYGFTTRIGIATISRVANTPAVPKNTRVFEHERFFDGEVPMAAAEFSTSDRDDRVPSETTPEERSTELSLPSEPVPPSLSASFTIDDKAFPLLSRSVE